MAGIGRALPCSTRCHPTSLFGATGHACNLTPTSTCLSVITTVRV